MDYQKNDWEGRRGKEGGLEGGGGGWGNEGSKRFMDVFGFFCLFGWVFFVLLDRNLIFRFVFVVFLNPYFDLFSLVNNLNFPHPSPPTPLKVSSPWG